MTAATADGGRLARLTALAGSRAAFAVVFALVALRLGMSAGGINVFEDPAITLRFSWNLAETGAWAFNPGDPPVEGATSFLWMAVNAGAALVSDDLMGNAQKLGFWLTAGALLLLGLAARRVHPLSGAVVLLVASITPQFAEYVYDGYESPLLWLLECAALLAFAVRATSERFRSNALSAGVGALLALAAMTRPEAVLFGTLIGVWLLPGTEQRVAERLRAVAIAAGVFAAVMIPYYVFKVSVFGHPFPSSFYVKVTPTPLYNWQTGWTYLKALFTDQPAWLIALAGLLPFGRAAVPYRLRLPALAGIACYTFFILHVGGDAPHNPGFRFFLFMAPFWWMALGALFAALTAGPMRRGLATAAVAVAALVLLFADVSLARGIYGEFYDDEPGAPQSARFKICSARPGAMTWMFETPDLPLPGFPYNQYPTVHASVGIWLRQLMGGPYVLASESAGHLPFFSGPDVDFIDLVGLASERCIASRHGDEAVFDYLAETRPDVYALEMVIREDGYGFGCRICDELIRRNPDYVMVAVVRYEREDPSDWYFPIGTTIFARPDRVGRFASLPSEGEPMRFRFAGREQTLPSSRVVYWEDLAASLCAAVRPADHVR